MEDDNSDLFNVERSKEVNLREMHFFNQNTEIIKEGQRFKVQYGQMEEQKKTIHQIVSPYLARFAATTAQVAAKAGSRTYEALKVGFLWVYNKFVDNIIPYAVENLPQVIFVTKKQKEQKPLTLNSGDIQVLLDQQDYSSLSKQEKDNKTRIVIPLGTSNDPHFEEWIKNEKYQVKYSFPIDIDSDDQINVQKSYMIPSQSYEAICEQVKQSHIQLQMEQAQNYKKVVYKLNNCFIFELQGKNTIEYDMLDSIYKAEDSKTGYIMFPQQTLRKSISDRDIENDPIAQLVNGKQEELVPEVVKVVDMERNVRVYTGGQKQKPEYDLALN